MARWDASISGLGYLLEPLAEGAPRTLGALAHETNEVLVVHQQQLLVALGVHERPQRFQQLARGLEMDWPSSSR